MQPFYSSGWRRVVEWVETGDEQREDLVYCTQGCMVRPRYPQCLFNGARCAAVACRVCAPSLSLE
eukprot:scaffold175903_cov25-Tisochrysis_lutea.AAC.1